MTKVEEDWQDRISEAHSILLLVKQEMEAAGRDDSILDSVAGACLQAGEAVALLEPEVQ